MVENEIYTVDDVIRILHLGRNTVYNMLNSGEIKAVRFGRQWRIPKKSIENIISRDV